MDTTATTTKKALQSGMLFAIVSDYFMTWIAEGKTFSAWEVFKAVESAFPARHIPEWNVKQFVEALAAMNMNTVQVTFNGQWRTYSKKVVVYANDDFCF